jgi:hypothetical protein
MGMVTCLMPYTIIGKWVGVVLLGLGLAWSIYAGIIRPTTKPNPTTTQKADNITNYTYNVTPRSTFGCASIKVYEYDQLKKGVIVNGL